MTQHADLGLGRIALRLAGAGAFVAALSFLPLGTLPRPALASFVPTDEAAAPAIEDAAVLLPDDLWVAVEARGLGELAAGFGQSRLFQRVTRSPTWKKFEQSPQHAQLLAGLAFAELVSGMKPAALAGALLGEQLVVGVVADGDQPGAVAAIRTSDADVAAHLVHAARAVAATSQSSGTKVATLACGAIEATVIDEKLWFGANGRHLLLASSEPLFRGLAERAQAASRRTPPLVGAMRGRAPGSPLLRFAFDVRKLAATRPDGRLAPAKSDNSGGAMLLGDLLELANRADVIGGTIDARGDARGDVLELAFDVPGEPAKLPQHFRSFGHANAQRPLPVLAPEGTLLSWSLRRDWAKFWEDRAELCDPATEKEFADLKQNLGLFFGGKSLPDDVLPQLDEEILFVLARQTYPGVADPPKVKFPAGAFVVRVKGDAAKLGRDFAIGVHSFLGLINLQRAMENLTPLLPFVEEFEGATVYGGRCLADDPRPADPVRFNVSPAATWVGEHVILSSSEELLHELVRELRNPATGSAAPGRSGIAPAGCTSYLRFDAESIRALAIDDRDALVTNAVIQDGKPQAQAEAEIDLLIEALGQLAHATLETRVLADGMRIEASFVLTPFAPTTPGPAAASVPAPAGDAR